MRGNITRRGKRSWRIKFDISRIDGVRKTYTGTVRGTRQDAQRELTRLLSERDRGLIVSAGAKITVADHLRQWLYEDAHGLAGKTVERYRQLAEQQIAPHLGRFHLEKLRPSHVQTWHATLLTSGLSPRTVGPHAHRVLHRALARAVAVELLSRNVASAISPPKVTETPIEILTAEQVRGVLDGLAGHWLLPIAVMAIGTGLRRGELLALRWQDVDIDKNGSVLVDRSLEQTRAGLSVKPPKTLHGRRTVPLPASAARRMRAHYKQQCELAMQLGAGKPELVFSDIEGAPIPPNNLSRDWRRICNKLKLPRVSFHALRHTYASALISEGLDAVRVSRLLGHGSPVVTMRVYAHMFARPDRAAAAILEQVLG